MREAAVQASIVRYVNRIPCCRARVNGPGPAHVAGDPDIYGCVRGRMFHCEVKQPGKKPTRAQELRIQEWLDAGAKVCVVNTLGAFKVWLEAELGVR